MASAKRARYRTEPVPVSVPKIWPAQDGVAEAVAVLRQGGLVAFPTETVYGLGARALDATAVGRIFAAKGRPPRHPLIVHVSGEGDARPLALGWPAAAAFLSCAFWPGPLTLVVDRADRIPGVVTGGGPSVAIRAPAHPVARALLAALGEPIAAPSANRHQSLSPTTAAHVVAQLGGVIDGVLDGGPCAAGIESTVVDVRCIPPVILRPGPIDRDALSRVVPGIVAASPRMGDDEQRASPGLARRHYAPRARLLLERTKAGAVDAARALAADGSRVGLVVYPEDDASSESGALLWRALPCDPAGYGRAIYRVLHELDDEGADVIVVLAVPEGEAWRAVADRLER